MHEPGKPLAFVGLLLIKKVRSLSPLISACLQLKVLLIQPFNQWFSSRLFASINDSRDVFGLNPLRVVCIFRVISSCPTIPRKGKPSGRSSSRFCLRRNRPSIVSRPWITCASFHSPPLPQVFLLPNRADTLSFSFLATAISSVAPLNPYKHSNFNLFNSPSQTGRAHLLLISATPGQAGGALGVITLEDIIEEIISEEIVDETDRYEDNQSKKRAKRMTTAAVMRG